MRLKSPAAVLAIAILLGANQSTADSYIPSQPLDDAIDPLFADNQGNTRAVLAIRNGQVEARRYAPGYSDQTRFISWSMAKSVTAVLVGELVADGKLKLDAPVPFAEWQKPGDPRVAITLRQMLHMSSGLSHTESGEPLYAADTNRALFVDQTGGIAAFALAKPLEAKPGEKYEYSSLTSLLLAELITRQLTDSKDPKTRARAYKAFAEERLFKPAGITSAIFDFDGAGTQVGGSIIYMTLEDWGRFGSLLLDGKGADGKEVIAPDWQTFLRTPSPTNAAYGGHVWLNRTSTAKNMARPALFPGKGPDSIFAAVGHLGQYVIVSPEHRLVLVRLGKTQDDTLQPVRDALGRVLEMIRMGDKI